MTPDPGLLVIRLLERRTLNLTNEFPRDLKKDLADEDQEFLVSGGLGGGWGSAERRGAIG